MREKFLASLHNQIRQARIMFGYLYSVLPSSNNQIGNLPYWLLLISVVSIFNSVQSYSKDLTLTRRVYERNAASIDKGAQVTNLSARTFGTWTFLASIVRLYAAYNVNNRAVYELAQFTFLIAGLHFGSEWLVFKTCNFGKGLFGPLFVSSMSLFWMFQQKSFYTSIH